MKVGVGLMLPEEMANVKMICFFLRGGGGVRFGFFWGSWRGGGRNVLFG